MPMTIGIIGRVAEGSDLCDGQTVKTRVLADELSRRYPDAQLIIADTYNYKRHFIGLISKIEQCLRKSDVIFILLSRNGRRVIFPIVDVLNRIYHKPVFHDVIGGAFEYDLVGSCILQVICSRFEMNWIESRKAVERLRAIGFKNVAFLPNFKRLSVLARPEEYKSSDSTYRFCTFSRVMKEKGIGIAAQAVIDINSGDGSRRAALDIYGPIESGYEEELQKYIDLSKGAVSYKGIVNFNDSVDVLKKYYMLLFPTTFDGEGFPGTLIDAFSAGLPVIATDWHYNGEIIAQDRTGFLYDPNETHRLKELIEYCMSDPERISEMRKNCLAEARQYDADTVMDTIAERIAHALSK